MKKNIYITILLALLSVNVLGVLLRLLELPSYIIIMGFRFHLSLVLPFLFIIQKLKFSQFKKEFTDPAYKNNYPFIISLIIVPLAVFIVIYFSGYIDLSDPDFFYEFGLSSVVDLPVYLIWNSLHLMMFYFFISVAFEKIKYKYIILFIVVILLFAYELIPLEGEEVNVTGIADLVITSLLISLLFISYRNIYWFILFSFLLVWIFVLLFGSSFAPVIHNVFAARYLKWEGFFQTASIYREYFYFLYASLITLVLFLLSFKKKS